MTAQLGSEFPGGTTTFGVGPACAETLADRARFLTEGLAPVACRSCGTEVLVRKNSHDQTSIQWTADAASACPNYAGPRWTGCAKLSDSITQAAKTGRITILDQEEA